MLTLKKRRKYKHNGGSAIKSLKKLATNISNGLNKLKHKALVKVALTHLTYLSIHNKPKHREIMEKAKFLQSKFEENDYETKKIIGELITKTNNESVNTLKKQIEDDTEYEIIRKMNGNGIMPTKKKIKKIIKNVNDTVSKILDKDGKIIEREAMKLGVTYNITNSKGIKHKRVALGGTRLDAHGNPLLYWKENGKWYWASNHPDGFPHEMGPRRARDIIDLLHPKGFLILVLLTLWWTYL